MLQGIVERAEEFGQVRQQRAFEATDQHQVVLDRELHRTGRLAQRLGHRQRPHRQVAPLQRRRRHQHGEAVTELVDGRAAARFAARGELVQRDGHLVLVGVDQAQRLVQRVGRRGRRQCAQLVEVEAQLFQEALFQRGALAHQPLAHVEVALLIERVVRGFRQREQLALEIVQAHPQRTHQPVRAQRLAVLQQPARAPGPPVARAAIAAARRRTASTLRFCFHG